MNARDLITGAGLLWLLFRKRGNGTETPPPEPETPPPAPTDCWNLTGDCWTFGPCLTPGGPSDPAVPPGARCDQVPPPVPSGGGGMWGALAMVVGGIYLATR